jgi:hypothetical protein
MTGTPTFSHGKGRHMHLHQRCGTTGKVSEWEYPGVTPNQSNTAESGAVNGTALFADRLICCLDLPPPVAGGASSQLQAAAQLQWPLY